MLENQSIICFAPDPWDSMWRNRHQIMSRLSQKNKILYVEPETYSARNGMKKGLKLLIKSLTGGGHNNRRVRNISNGLWVYQHPWWGINSNLPLLGQVGNLLRIYTFHHTMRKLQMKSPILWIVDPRFGSMIRYFKKPFICYHVVDNYTAAPYYPEEIRAELKQAENYMLSVADLIIVTSPFLLEEKRKLNSNVHLVKNAVDYEKFAAVKDVDKIPNDMEHIPKPVIGYIGAVNKKLDYELLDMIARARPQWSFVFVGEIYSKTPGSQIYNFINQHHPNIYLLGRRDVKDVPYYIRACDICIMPYRQDEYTKAIDSLKLYEYFACEKPVVSTDIPAIQEHSQVVYMAKDTNDFINKLEEALACSTSVCRRMQRAIAMQNTWENRVEQLSVLIQSALLKKSSCA